MFRHLRWRIAVPFGALSALVIIGLGAFLLARFRVAYMDDLVARMESSARYAGETWLVRGSGFISVEPIRSLALRPAGLSGARVSIIGLEGTVLVDSEGDPDSLPNQRYRTEVIQALAEGKGVSQRSAGAGEPVILYVATIIDVRGEAVGISRIGFPLSEIDALLGNLRRVVGLATAGALLATLLLAILISDRTARPIGRLTRVVERMAEGDLSHRIWPSSEDEVGRLTVAFNRMAGTLERELDQLAWERGQMSGVLEHMADGVLIINEENEVILLNPAASRILGVPSERALGRSYAQVVRHHELVGLLRLCRETGVEQTAAIEVAYAGQFLNVIVTPLAQAETPGYLIILQDLTRIRRLETVRRDFVSNISHELRTPLASLKALVETLRGGALEDPPAAERFLTMAETEVDALTQMVQELLDLARIESRQVPLNLAPASPREVALPPADRLAPQAERAHISLSVDVPEGLPDILADSTRIQTVFTNLIHNAIKFTPPEGEIVVSAESAGSAVRFSVRDTGVGISPDDVPRIFERFYKADRSRSGGGTGLGLAISRHLVQAHGGDIWVESVEGQGSTFFFTVPVAGDTSD